MVRRISGNYKEFIRIFKNYVLCLNKSGNAHGDWISGFFFVTIKKVAKRGRT